MRRDPSFALLLACFVLSGFAGLIYETAWTQQLSLLFGTSELAVAAVLAAYMGGLLLGAVLAARLLDRVRRPLLVYGLLELGIAVSALAVPTLLDAVRAVQIRWLGGRPDLPSGDSLGAALFDLFATFLVLLPPTAMMGATLPLLARHAVARDTQLGPRVGLLYAANTMGAAVGTVVAAFVLLPALGLGRTVWAAAGVNGLVFLVAVLLVRASGKGATQTFHAASIPDAVPTSGAWILPLILLSGAVSLTGEILWTRLLSHLLGGSVYAFAVMLATYLVGIALGSAVASRRAADAASARSAFILAQLGGAAMSYLAFGMVDRLPALLRDAGTGEPISPLLGAAAACATLLPGALFLGATFPLAVRILADGAHQAGTASARVFAWNTLGAVGGAIGAGFVLLPALRLTGTLTAMVAVGLGLALLAALCKRPRRRALAAVAVGGLLALAALPPPTPWNVLRTTPLSGRPISGEIEYYGVGRGANVLLFADDGEWRLTTNGLPESSIQPAGARIGRFTVARWLALLPHVGHAEIDSLLIIGLGAGLTLDAVAPGVREIDLVELEEEVVRANRAVADRRARDPLADPRLRIHLNDARGALQLSSKRFDAIVSQPSHPWTAGASHLFTREFFTLAREHHEPPGVFVQWIGLRFVDEALLRTLLATLLDVFPQVEVYEPLPGGGILFLAGNSAWDARSGAASALAADPEQWRRLGILTAEDLLAARRLDTAGSRLFARDAPLATDQHNLLRIRSPHIRAEALDSRRLDKLLAGLRPAGPPSLSLPSATAAALREGRRRLALGRPREIESLEPELAAVPPRHALFLQAGRLRIAWRRASGDPRRAREALDLHETLLVRGPFQPAQILLRAELAILAGDVDVALAALAEIETVLRRNPASGERAKALLDRIGVPPDDPRARRLREALSSTRRGVYHPPDTRRDEATSRSHQPEPP